MARPNDTPRFEHTEEASTVLFCLIDDACTYLNLGFYGATWVRWGTFSVYGVRLHLICATNGVPL